MTVSVINPANPINCANITFGEPGNCVPTSYSHPYNTICSPSGEFYEITPEDRLDPCNFECVTSG